MDWHEVPLTEHMVEAARVVGEAEVVIAFSDAARGWFRVTVLEDLRASGDEERYFARAQDRDDPLLMATAEGSTPEQAATLCLREAGVSLRRARGK